MWNMKERKHTLPLNMVKMTPCSRSIDGVSYGRVESSMDVHGIGIF